MMVKKFLLLVALTILVAATVFTSVGIYKNKQLAKRLEESSHQENWAEYTDNHLGLTFKYPKGWVVTKEERTMYDIDDYYLLRIEDPSTSITEMTIESTKDEVFRKIQVERLIGDPETKNVSINGKEFMKWGSKYYFYLGNKAPIRFTLYNFYQGEIFSQEITYRMNIILKQIMESTVIVTDSI